MRQPHKHAEVIKAWADGATIEWRRDGHCCWYTMNNDEAPGFYSQYEYRIKPEVIKIEYRVALLKYADIFHPCLITSRKHREVEQDFNFVRWLTDPVVIEQEI